MPKSKSSKKSHHRSGNTPKRAIQIARRYLKLQQFVEKVKIVYNELDQLAVELNSLKVKRIKLRNIEVRVVDNFAEKNTVFRPVGIKRFQLEHKPFAKIK